MIIANVLNELIGIKICKHSFKYVEAYTPENIEQVIEISWNLAF